MTIEINSTAQKLNPYDGREIKDSKGNLIRLRKPQYSERYNLLRMMGKDAENSECRFMMMPLLYVDGINGAKVNPPTTYAECMALLNRLDEEGCAAIATVLLEEFGRSTEEEIEEIKK